MSKYIVLKVYVFIFIIKIIMQMDCTSSVIVVPGLGHVDVLCIFIHVADARSLLHFKLNETLVAPVCAPRVLNFPVPVVASRVLKASALRSGVIVVPPLVDKVDIGHRCCVSISVTTTFTILVRGIIALVLGVCRVSEADKDYSVIDIIRIVLPCAPFTTLVDATSVQLELRVTCVDGN